MFSFYGLSGLDFRGTLEQLGQVRGVTAARPGRATARVGEEHLTTFVAPGGVVPGDAQPGEEGAVQAYQDMLQLDQERGPLYHAHQIMSREVVTLGTGDSVQDAWRTLRDNDVRQAPVLDPAETLVGLVTERDLLTAFNLDGDRIRDLLPRRVADVMSSPVLSVDPVTDIRRIARAMLEFNLTGVPVVNETHALVGFVTRGDILRAIMADPPLSMWG